MHARGLALLAAVAFMVPAAAQTTWWVDDDGVFPGTGTPSDPYATIQFAISRPTTLDGDTIQVLEGTYLESLDFLGKTLVVRSTDGAGLTLVDARQTGSVVTVAHGEGSGTALEGFTLTGGSAATGGGVRCVGSALVLRACHVVANEAADGGGVYASDAQLVLEDCRVELNVADQAREGGGVWIGAGSVATVEGCEIVANHVPGVSHGGGMFVGDATVTVRGCTFRENTVGGAIHADPGYGGGLYSACAADVTVEGSLFAGNGGAVFAGAGLYGAATVRETRFEENGYGYGGTSIGTGTGGGAGAGGCLLELHDCTLVGNVAFGEGGNGYGGGVADAALVRGCELVGNRANFGGGALSSNLVDCLVRENLVIPGGFSQQALGAGLLGGSAIGTRFERNEARGIEPFPFAQGGGAAGADLERCVLVGNRAQAGGGLSGNEAVHCSFFGNEADFYGAAVSMGDVRDSIVWGHGPDPLGPQVTVAYSLVEGGAPGTGNLDGSPRYWAPLAGDLHLLPGSACIDAADPAGPADPDGSRADMGAFPFDGAHCGIPGPYCEAVPSSLGCSVHLTTSGTPTLVGADDFFVHAEDVVSGQTGLLLWSPRASARAVFGGVLCLGDPPRRLALANSGGNPAALDCSGRFDFHLSHALMAQAGLHTHVPLHLQVLYRDPRGAAGEHVVMSDALELVLCP